MSVTLLANPQQYHTAGYATVDFIAQLEQESQSDKKQVSGTSRKRNRSAKEREGNYLRTVRLRQIKAERELREYLDTKAPLCLMGHQGDGSREFMSTLHYTLRRWCSTTKVTFERWLEMIIEWNNKLQDPFHLATEIGGCAFDDSFWRKVTEVLLTVAAETVPEEREYRRTLQLPGHHDRIGEQRLYMFYSYIENLYYLFHTLGYGHVRRVVVNTTADRCPSLPLAVRLIRAEIANNIHRLGDYMAESRVTHYREQNTESNTGYRFHRVEKRIEALRAGSVYSPAVTPTTPSIATTSLTQHSEKQLPLPARHLPEFKFNDISPVNLKEEYSDNALSPISKVVESPVISAFDSLLNEIISVCSFPIMVGPPLSDSCPSNLSNTSPLTVSSRGSPLRFEFTEQFARDWIARKELQREKLRTIPLLNIQDCLTSITSIGGYWNENKGEYTLPKSVQYDGFNSRDIPTWFRNYVDEYYPDVATAVSYTEPLRMILGNDLESMTEAHRIAKQAPPKAYCYSSPAERHRQQRDSVSSLREQVYKAKQMRDRLKLEIDDRRAERGWLEKENPEYVRLTFEIDTLDLYRGNLLSDLPHWRARLKELGSCQANSIKMSLPACTANGPVRVHHSKGPDYRGKEKLHTNVRWREDAAILLSGVVSVDLDNIPTDKMEEVRTKLIKSSLASIIFKTASGNGYWVLARYDRDVFGWDEAGWHQAQSDLINWIHALGLGKYLDYSCTDKSRYRILCHDPDCFYDEFNTCQLRPLFQRPAKSEVPAETETETDGIAGFKYVSPFHREENIWDEDLPVCLPDGTIVDRWWEKVETRPQDDFRYSTSTTLPSFLGAASRTGPSA